MRLSHLAEPELEFGSGLRHTDIRFGIMDYGPFDLSAQNAPKRIKLGIIGTAETLEGTAKWVHSCSEGFASKPSRQPNLFPPFPGLRNDETFHCDFLISSELQRKRCSQATALRSGARM